MLFLIFPGLVCSCSAPETDKEPAEEHSLELLSFTITSIADNAELWWARTLTDVDGDGIMDIALINNNGSGGWLGYLKGNTQGTIWERVIVAETSPNGKPFAAGDLDAADLDLDGDIDLIGVEHPGEWSDADADAVLFWYQQHHNQWIPHTVGRIPSALKDICVKDLDLDQIPEIVTVTYNAETLSVFKNNADDDFKKAWDLKIDNLHEGLDIGDVDGDGWPDIVANGYWLPNSGTVMQPWRLKIVDSLWFNQEEDHWARKQHKITTIWLLN